MRRLIGFLILCISLITSCPSSWAAITFVSRVNIGNTASASSIDSPAQSHTAGNLLVALIHWSTTETFSSISDTAGNTWIWTGTQLNRTGNNSLRTYYAWNCLGNGSNIVTASFSAPTVYRWITVYEFSGVQNTSNPFDQEQTGTGSGTAISTSMFTISAPSEVIIESIVDTEAITDATFTLINFNVTGDSSKYFADGYHITSLNESATATGNSGNWIDLAASFKVSAVQNTLTISNGGTSTFTIENKGSSTLTITK